MLLGEYRKTKVGLKLKGEVKDGKLAVTFDARDYLDRPVKGTSATLHRHRRPQPPTPRS